MEHLLDPQDEPFPQKNFEAGRLNPHAVSTDGKKGDAVIPRLAGDSFQLNTRARVRDRHIYLWDCCTGRIGNGSPNGAGNRLA
jgi:hypothetical protein